MLFPLLHAHARKPGIPRRSRVRKGRANFRKWAQGLESEPEIFAANSLEIGQIA